MALDLDNVPSISYEDFQQRNHTVLGNLNGGGSGAWTPTHGDAGFYCDSDYCISDYDVCGVITGPPVARCLKCLPYIGYSLGVQGSDTPWVTLSANITIDMSGHRDTTHIS